MSGLRFRFDATRCTGCEACAVACWTENRVRMSRPWRKVLTFNAHRHPDLPVIHASLACHHCDEPACLAGCPASAYRKDPATGAVTVDRDACMGCRYCTWACPHDAPRFAEAAGTVEKCTFCAERLERGLEPACASRCPLGALAVEPREGRAGGPAPPGFHGWDLEPGIRFVLDPTAPRMPGGPERGVADRALAGLLRVPEPRITLKGEWTLVVFTTVLSAAVAVMAAGGPRRAPWLHLGALAAAMGLSLVHLGRPERAWRAVLNLRSSWVSREIALVSLFMGLCAASFLGLVPAWAAAAAGFAALYAVDRVYQVALQVPSGNFHSAHALLNGAYLAGILLAWKPLALGAGALKLGLYAWRKAHFLRRGRPWRPLAALVRAGLGFGLPAFLPGPWAFLAALAGDLVDRCEYYAELDVPSPEAGMKGSARLPGFRVPGEA
ncbi:MAG TPA: DmsC/YnfH family molybdoenzyme membrane anchor subunit [Holophaga sp.]|nr:DmsC/YnfH family molybdoenzyme membrane anchor subunit [Holophaga sp.]